MAKKKAAKKRTKLIIVDPDIPESEQIKGWKEKDPSVEEKVIEEPVEEAKKVEEFVRGQEGIRCRNCHCPTSSVYETRRSRFGLRRRRICDHCGFRFTTGEREID